MELSELTREEYVTLRDEIKATRFRAFCFEVVGLIGVPILVYLACQVNKELSQIVPFSALAIIVAYLAEMSNMMRAARYIRENIEKKSGGALGWEAWLESRGELRHMERHFASCFVVILFLYYFLTIAITMDRYIGEVRYDTSNLTRYWLVSLAFMYVVGAIWAFATLVRHWKTAVSTSA